MQHLSTLCSAIDRAVAFSVVPLRKTYALAPIVRFLARLWRFAPPASTTTPPPVILGSGPKVMCLTLPFDRVQEAEYNLTRGTARR